jgi:hypothetical protein
LADVARYTRSQDRLNLSCVDKELKLIMPWILRFAIGSLFVFLIGVAMIAWACASTGWETLGRLAWGCVTAGGGLIVSALLAMVSAVIHKTWRRFSLGLMSAAILLFLALLIFSKFA